MTPTCGTAGEALIIGAGIAGSAAAVALAQAGWGVTLCEQAPEIAEVGAGLQISPNGSRALDALGLLSQVRSRAVEPRAAVLRDGLSGRRILDLELEHRAGDRWGAPYLHLHRADLLALLLEACVSAGVDIRTNARIAPETLMTDAGGRGGPYLIVNASGVRGGTGDRVAFTGQVAWRALVPASALPVDLVQREATVWMGPGCHLVTYLLRGGDLVNLVAVEEREHWAPETWSHPGDPDALRQVFRGWHGDIAQVVAAVETCFLWGLFDRPVPASLHDGNTVLIGDAAHPMLPFLAQGAAMALEDAVCLGRCMFAGAGEGPVADGLARFSALRRDRVARVQRQSAGNARLFHMSGTLPRLVVHGTIATGSRLFPGLAASRFDWLYGHDVRETG